MALSQTKEERQGRSRPTLRVGTGAGFSLKRGKRSVVGGSGCGVSGGCIMVWSSQLWMILAFQDLPLHLIQAVSFESRAARCVRTWALTEFFGAMKVKLQ